MSAERGTPEQCEPPAGESAEKAKEFHQLTAQEGVEAVERGDKPTVLIDGQ